MFNVFFKHRNIWYYQPLLKACDCISGTCLSWNITQHFTGPIKCYGQFNIPHEPATLERYSKECGKVIDKEILYYKANTAAIGKSEAFVGSVTEIGGIQ